VKLNGAGTENVVQDTKAKSIIRWGEAGLGGKTCMPRFGKQSCINDAQLRINEYIIEIPRNDDLNLALPKTIGWRVLVPPHVKTRVACSGSALYKSGIPCITKYRDQKGSENGFESVL
jgi:hypothetical protein